MSQSDFKTHPYDCGNAPQWGNEEEYSSFSQNGHNHGHGGSNKTLEELSESFEQFMLKAFDKSSESNNHHGRDNKQDFENDSDYFSSLVESVVRNMVNKAFNEWLQSEGKNDPINFVSLSENNTSSHGNNPNPSSNTGNESIPPTSTIPPDSDQPVIDAESGARLRPATTSQTDGSSVVPPTPDPDPEVVREPIVVKAGETFDGKGMTFTAGPELGDGGQSEDQKPLFILEDGATLKNVVIGDNGADGVHVYGDAKIDDVHWTDVGEDALTIKPNEEGKKATVEITNSSAMHANDKIFQMNADANIRIDNFYAEDFGNFLISNGHQQGEWDIELSNLTLKDGKHSVVHSNNNNGTNVTLDNIAMENVKRTYVLTDNATLRVV